MEVATAAKLLDRRELCLGNLIAISLEFIDLFKGHSAQEIQDFLERRRAIFNSIETIDSQLTSYPLDQLKQALSPQFSKITTLQNQLKSIDSQIMAMVSSEKSKVLNELQKVSNHRRAMAGYRTKEYEIERAEGQSDLDNSA